MASHGGGSTDYEQAAEETYSKIEADAVSAVMFRVNGEGRVEVEHRDDAHHWAANCQIKVVQRLLAACSTDANFILLENVVHGMRRPCVQDLKIRFLQHGDDAPFEKQQALRRMYAESTSVALWRSRYVFERALDVDHRSITIWLQKAEMEMSSKQINHSCNIFDRAVTILQFWLKYSNMEELLENVPGARQVYERWMEWDLLEQAWLTYIKFETRYKEIDHARSVWQQDPQGEELLWLMRDIVPRVEMACFCDRAGATGRGAVVYNEEDNEEEVKEEDEQQVAPSDEDGDDDQTYVPSECTSFDEPAMEIPPAHSRTRQDRREMERREDSRREDELFMHSLLPDHEGERHPEAMEYLGDGVKEEAQKRKLAEKLFLILNKHMYRNKLVLEFGVAPYLGSTAGCCRAVGEVDLILLSPATACTADRILRTVMHELAHSAVRRLSQRARRGHSHGETFFSWAEMNGRVFPSLPPIEQYHHYSELETDWSSWCTRCGRMAYSRFRMTEEYRRISTIVCQACIAAEVTARVLRERALARAAREKAAKEQKLADRRALREEETKKKKEAEKRKKQGEAEKKRKKEEAEKKRKQEEVEKKRKQEEVEKKRKQEEAEEKRRIKSVYGRVKEQRKNSPPTGQISPGSVEKKAVTSDEGVVRGIHVNEEIEAVERRKCAETRHTPGTRHHSVSSTVMDDLEDSTSVWTNGMLASGLPIFPESSGPTPGTRRPSVSSTVLDDLEDSTSVWTEEMIGGGLPILETEERRVEEEEEDIRGYGGDGEETTVCASRCGAIQMGRSKGQKQKARARELVLEIEELRIEVQTVTMTSLPLVSQKLRRMMGKIEIGRIEACHTLAEVAGKLPGWQIQSMVREDLPSLLILLLDSSPAVSQAAINALSILVPLTGAAAISFIYSSHSGRAADGDYQLRIPRDDFVDECTVAACLAWPGAVQQFVNAARFLLNLSLNDRVRAGAAAKVFAYALKTGWMPPQMYDGSIVRDLERARLEVDHRLRHVFERVLHYLTGVQY